MNYRAGRNRADRTGLDSSRDACPHDRLLTGVTSARITSGRRCRVPAAFHGPDDSEQTAAQAASFADLPWWEVFKDPQLQELIRTALKQNYDLLHGGGAHQCRPRPAWHYPFQPVSASFG